MFRKMRDRQGMKPSIGMALCTSALLTATIGCSGPASPTNETSPTPRSDPPNILMVLMDDLGYSDIGAYGSEISTPVIDALARQGTQFTDFHAYSVCAPSRAALMTGQDPHRVGLGSMEGAIAPGIPLNTPGYKGSLEGRYTSIAQILSDAGYNTYQAGKWHLGTGPNQTPQALGFDQNYTMYQGGASHYADALRLVAGQQPPADQVTYEHNGQRIDQLPEDFYSTNAYTDEMLTMIDNGQDEDRPFFGYLAYTAPHDPLHVPDTELIQKYFELYSGKSVEQLRANRIDAMADNGLINRDVATRWPVQTPEATTLTSEQQRDLTYRMAVYSAMIEHVDTQLGRIVEHLKATGDFDDTLIVVASDNGASGLSSEMYARAPGARQWLTEHYPLIGDIDAYGKAGSFPVPSLSNAQVSSGPYFHTKNTLYEGGIRVPLIVKTPNAANDQDSPRIVDTFAHISDLYPTFADYAGASLHEPNELSGNSAKPLLDGTTNTIGDDQFGWELFGERAFRDGDLKLVFATPGNSGTGQYALYDLSKDPGETTDLASEQPDQVRRLSDLWDQYAADNNVIPVEFAAVNAASEALAPVIYAMDWAE